MRLLTGETATVFYKVTNRSNQPQTGIATYVCPGHAYEHGLAVVPQAAPAPAPQEPEAEQLPERDDPVAELGSFARPRRPQVAPKPRRPITDDERRLVLALQTVTFAPADPGRKFVRDMQHVATTTAAGEITEGQARYVRNLVRKYHKQINPRQVPASETHLLSGRIDVDQPLKQVGSRWRTRR